MYSNDLSNMIKGLLQVNPKKRPNCDDILNMAIVIEKMRDLGLEEEGNDLGNLVGSELLGTIQVPKNLKILRDKLPKPHYHRASDQDEDERSLPQVVHRNKSTKANRSGMHLVGSEIPVSGSLASASRISVEQKLKSAIKASVAANNEAKKLSPSIELCKEGSQENLMEEKGVKLPDIRRGVAPIKKPPPRVLQPAKSPSELADIYLQPQAKRLPIDPLNKIANPYADLIENANNEKSARLKKIYEEINKRKAAMVAGGDYASPPEKVKQPIIQNVYHNAYHIYQQPVIVRPSWWG